MDLFNFPRLLCLCTEMATRKYIVLTKEKIYRAMDELSDTNDNEADLKGNEITNCSKSGVNAAENNSDFDEFSLSSSDKYEKENESPTISL